MRAVSSCHAAAVCSPIAYRNPSHRPTRCVSVSTAKPEVDDEVSSVVPLNRRRLILLRHAESTVPDRFLRDHDRPLSKTGRADAMSISHKLHQMDWIPELILCRLPASVTAGNDANALNILECVSDATRTKETLKIMQEYSKEFSRAEVHFMPSFYSIAAMDGQTAEHLQKVVCQYSRDEILTIMCMGHNRGWEEAASMFSGSSIELKTCNAALLETTGESWNEAFASAGLGGWKLEGIVRPTSAQ